MLNSRVDIITISVLIPVYNREKELRPLLDVLSRLDAERFEIIFSDNGSDDNSVMIINQFASQRKNVSVFEQRVNLGALANFSFLFSKATGDYCMLMPVGDIVDEDYLQSMLDFCESKVNAEVIFPVFAIYKGNALVYRVRFMEIFSQDIVKKYGVLIEHMPGICIYGLYKTSLIRQFLPIPIMRGGDLSFIRIISSVGRVAVNTDATYIFNAKSQWNSRVDDQKFFFGEGNTNNTKFKDYRALYFFNILRYEFSTLSKLKLSKSELFLVFFLQMRQIVRKLLKKIVTTFVNLLPSRLSIEFIEILYWKYWKPKYVSDPQLPYFLHKELYPYLGIKANLNE